MRQTDRGPGEGNRIQGVESPRHNLWTAPLRPGLGGSPARAAIPPADASAEVRPGCPRPHEGGFGTCSVGLMFVLYIDETYNKREWWAVGMLVPISRVNALSQGLDEALDGRSVGARLPAVAEWHGYDLFHQAGAFSDLHPRQCIALYGKALDILAAEPVRFIFRGVDRQKLNRRYKTPYHPHRVAVAGLIESADNVLQRTSDHCYALVIADEHNETRTVIGGDLRRAQAGGDLSWSGANVERIVDSVHYVRSHESPLVQATDLVAFLMLRRRTVPSESDARAEAAVSSLCAKYRCKPIHQYFWEP